MDLQPVFKNCRIREGSVSEDFFARGLCLPSGTQLTEEDLDRIVKGIRSCQGLKKTMDDGRGTR